MEEAFKTADFIVCVGRGKIGANQIMKLKKNCVICSLDLDYEIDIDSIE